jgi:hypothetical protein
MFKKWKNLDGNNIWQRCKHIWIHCFSVVTYYLCRKLLQVSEYGPGGSGGCTFETKLILVQFVDGQNVE